MISDPKLPFASEPTGVGELKPQTENPVSVAGPSTSPSASAGTAPSVAPHRGAPVCIFMRDARRDADDFAVASGLVGESVIDPISHAAGDSGQWFCTWRGERSGSA
jgi:hypothetical protein